MRTQKQIERLNLINSEWTTIEAEHPSLIDSILDTDITQELPIYIYKGQYVIIVDSDIAEELSLNCNGDRHIVLLSDINRINIDDISMSYDDEYSCYTTIEEIVDEQCINMENEHCLLNEFIRLSYYRANTTRMQLVIETGRNHEWTSARTELSEECIDTINRAWEWLSEEPEDINEQIEILQHVINERKNLIDRYSEINKSYYYAECEDEIPTYNDIIKQCSCNTDAPNNFCKLFLF